MSGKARWIALAITDDVVQTGWIGKRIDGVLPMLPDGRLHAAILKKRMLMRAKAIEICCGRIT